MSDSSSAGTTPAHASPVNGHHSLNHEATTSIQQGAGALPYSLSHTKSVRASTFKQRGAATTFEHQDDGPRKGPRSITFAEPAPQLSERDSIFADHYVPTQLNTKSTGGEGSDLSLELTARPAVTTSAMSAVMTQTVSPASSPTRQNLAKTIPNNPSKYKLQQYQSAAASTLSKSNVPGTQSSGRGTIHGVRRINSDGHTWTKKFHFNVAQQASNEDSLCEEPLELEDNMSDLKMADSTGAVDEMANKSQALVSSRAIIESSQIARNERSVSRGRGRVDKSIEAKVKNPETSGNVRSRKASHMMGIFDPQDIKSTDDTSKSPSVDVASQPSRPQSRSSPALTDDFVPVTNGDYFSPHIASVRSDTISEEKFDVLETSSPTDVTTISPTEKYTLQHYEVKPHSPLPSNLLHAIRTTTREQLTPVSGDRSVATVPDAHDISKQESVHDEEEHISGAVYYPHSGPSADDIESFESPDDNEKPEKRAEATVSKSASKPDKRTNDEHVQEETLAHIDISVESEHEPSHLYFHGNLEQPKVPEDDETDENARTPRMTAVDSRPRLPSISASESEVDYSDDPTSLQEGATTPTQKDIWKRTARSGSVVSKPRGHVVLEPFKHQVGGHSTMYHLSRRAVCKQLNNRENEFYERVEQTHPELLKFMPRYIGVLNVTFSRGPKNVVDSSQSSTVGEKGTEANSNGRKSFSDTHPASDASSESKSEAKEANPQPRIVSHSQQIDTLPQVMLNQNKHIVPSNYFDLPERPKSADPQHIRNGISIFSSENGETASSNQNGSSQHSPSRPAQPVHSPSWGTTTVNVGLRDRILREVFGPPPIKYHRRGHHVHSTLPKAKTPGLHRRSNLSIESYDTSSKDSGTQRPHTAHQPETSGDQIKTLRPEATLSPTNHYSTSASAFDEYRNDLTKVSSATSESTNQSLGEERRQVVRRRHSGMGLRRRRKSVSDNEMPDLEYIEDEALLLGKEDELFSMDEDSVPPVLNQESAPAELVHMAAEVENTSTYKDESEVKAVETQPRTDTPPPNPRAARSKSQDQRYEFYIVLEDLTSGMGRPCILDLKMGTRQYGIEATRKKVESQRRKCKTTTSGQLGVRICGMQTFNVRTQKAGYEDKYFGRDVRAGKEFREALVRFLYDGDSYNSVARHIPTILHRISKLESMVRRLPGYRFYGSSLILFYDAEPDKSKEYREAVQNGVDLVKQKQKEGKKWPPSIELKLIDFANCVTGEDELPDDTNAPPAHPHEIDRGYLRGLKTLKAYFTQILKDIQKEAWAERTETDDAILGDEKPVDGPEASTHRGAEHEAEEEGEVSV